MYKRQVVRCAAVRADNDIICFFEFLFAYGAGIALVISHVLENAGVFKQDAAGQAAFLKFMESVGYRKA